MSIHGCRNILKIFTDKLVSHFLLLLFTRSLLIICNLPIFWPFFLRSSLEHTKFSEYIILDFGAHLLDLTFCILTHQRCRHYSWDQALRFIWRRWYTLFQSDLCLFKLNDPVKFNLLVLIFLLNHGNQIWHIVTSSVSLEWATSNFVINRCYSNSLISLFNPSYCSSFYLRVMSSCLSYNNFRNKHFTLNSWDSKLAIDC